MDHSFNTASGRCCCNVLSFTKHTNMSEVSIPRAVGVVATAIKLLFLTFVVKCFNTASGRCCCNLVSSVPLDISYCFNTASGRCCCNQ